MTNEAPRQTAESWIPLQPSDAGRPVCLTDRVSLCDTLDRVLNKGVVVVGEVLISVADIELVYLGLQLVLTSIESGRSAVAATAVDTALPWVRPRGDRD